MVKPAILKTIERVEQRHVQEADHLTNRINGEKTDNHSLNEEEGLEEEVEEHISNDLAHTWKGLSFTSGHFKSQISNILEPNGIDYLAENKQRKDPEGAKH